MSKGKNPPQPTIPVRLHPEAEAEFATLDAQTRADVAVILGKLHGKTHQEIVRLLDDRSEPKVAQWERGNRAGALRVVFAWGKGALWFIGAFVKVSNADGERKIARILPRADAVKNLGA